MNTKNPRITQSRLQELMRYDPEVGLFWWLQRPLGYRYPITTPAGATRKDGYILIGIDSVRYYGHHLAWLYMTGEWPEYLDHRDGNPNNNRFSNLRKATHHQNMLNRKIERGNACGYKGVWLQGKAYYCQTRLGDVKVRGGPFKTPEAAHVLYLKLIEFLHGEFARSG